MLSVLLTNKSSKLSLYVPERDGVRRAHVERPGEQRHQLRRQRQRGLRAPPRARRH